MQRSPPQAHLHVPGTPTVLPVLVGRGGVEFRIPQVSDGREEYSRTDPCRSLPSFINAHSHLGTCST